ncbi:unnamed protein product [Callosobruchus maculatus]|uniref:Uncharacterized protein n=1 Tax=Callosobruchus maculatus TaxID=64391 RepID=A0A653C906_CALMS|nr:unnamed protein product [Callosobruchus maculatus]
MGEEVRRDGIYTKCEAKPAAHGLLGVKITCSKFSLPFDVIQIYRRANVELKLSRTSLGRILKLDLKLHPYKIQLVQELKPNDLNLRKSYAETMSDRFSNFNNLLFSDKAHFHLNGHQRKSQI